MLITLFSFSSFAEVDLLPMQKMVTSSLFKTFYSKVFDFSFKDIDHSLVRDKISLANTTQNPCNIELSQIADFVLNDTPITKAMVFRADCPFEGKFIRSMNSKLNIEEAFFISQY